MRNGLRCSIRDRAAGALSRLLTEVSGVRLYRARWCWDINLHQVRHTGTPTCDNLLRSRGVADRPRAGLPSRHPGRRSQAEDQRTVTITSRSDRRCGRRVGMFWHTGALAYGNALREPPQRLRQSPGW